MSRVGNLLARMPMVEADEFKKVLDQFRKMGLDDEKKLQGMLTRAKEIAKEQGKEGDKDTIVGIMQSFLKG